MKKRILFMIPITILAVSTSLPYVYADEIIEETAIAEVEQEDLIITISNGEISSNLEDISLDKYVSVLENEVVFTLDGEEFNGRFILQSSKLRIELKNGAIFTGSITTDDGEAILVMDEESFFVLTQDSHITSLENDDLSYTNIDRNEYELVVDESFYEEENDSLVADETLEEEVIDSTQDEVVLDQKVDESDATSSETSTEESQSSTSKNKHSKGNLTSSHNRVKSSSIKTSSSEEKTDQASTIKQRKKNSSNEDSSSKKRKKNQNEKSDSSKKERGKVKEEDTARDEENTVDDSFKNSSKDKGDTEKNDSNQNIFQKIIHAIKSFFGNLWK